jgi:hypothetical protein
MCNYHDVILHKIMCFLKILNMNIHKCHSKTMFHLFEYLKYWLHTNIVHINHNMEFMRFLYGFMKTIFQTKFVQTYEVW